MCDSLFEIADSLSQTTLDYHDALFDGRGRPKGAWKNKLKETHFSASMKMFFFNCVYAKDKYEKAYVALGLHTDMARSLIAALMAYEESEEKFDEGLFCPELVLMDNGSEHVKLGFENVPREERKRLIDFWSQHGRCSTPFCEFQLYNQALTQQYVVSTDIGSNGTIQLVSPDIVRLPRSDETTPVLANSNQIAHDVEHCVPAIARSGDLQAATLKRKAGESMTDEKDVPQAKL